jgi:TnpA family transposase
MKTLHILRYIQEEPLRDAIQLQLNRGEFRHILAKSPALCSSRHR